MEEGIRRLHKMQIDRGGVGGYDRPVPFPYIWGALNLIKMDNRTWLFMNGHTYLIETEQDHGAVCDEDRTDWFRMTPVYSALSDQPNQHVDAAMLA